jgi:hypothetical protein
MTPIKSFDCVEMKHRAAARVRKELKGKSVAERLMYWHDVKKEMKKKRTGKAKRHNITTNLF